MTSWDKTTAEKKQEIYEKVAAIYESNGHPSWLQAMTVSTEMVNVLMAGQFQESSSVKIEGKCSSDDAELAKTITAELEKAFEGVEVAIKICAGISVGSKMSDIENVNLVMESGQTTIKHEAGQVLLVDFWATWCPPCQAPMAHNQKMLEEHGEKWAGKVRIIGCSIDNDAGTVKSHVESKKWTSVEHYHVKTEGCTASDAWGVEGVPHVALVDTEGKIVFMGHPASRPDLVKDFDTLLAGGKLSGVADAAAKDEDSDDAPAGLDDENATKALIDFKASGEMLRSDEHKDKFSCFQRCFFVLVDEAKFNAKSKKMNHDMTCHTMVMGGDAEKLEIAKTILEENNKGPWKNQTRFQA